MPGETVEEIDREFFAWLETIFAHEPELFGVRPVVEFPIRWLPGSAIEWKCCEVETAREEPRRPGNQAATGDCEETWNERNLSSDIVLWYPPNLAFADHVNCFDALNRSPRRDKDRKRWLALNRRLIARWSCSTTLFKYRTGRQRQCRPSSPVCLSSAITLG
jgi:hypothetical protein